jgi:hypothetical protein
MPRISHEARSASYYLSGGKPPEPPSHLSVKAKAIWRGIARSRPPDFFTAGALPLLEAYVETIVVRRFYTEMWARDRGNADYVKALVSINSSLSQLATKLRLANTSIDKRSGHLTERGDPAPDAANVLLFGGGERRLQCPAPSNSN